MNRPRLQRVAWRAYVTARRVTATLVFAAAQRMPRLPVPAIVLTPLANTAAGTATLEAVATWAQQRIDRTHGVATDAPPRLRALAERVLIERGRIAYHTREPGDGLEWFTEAQRQLGPSAQSWTWIGLALRRLGDLTGAKQAGEAALVLDPRWRPALVHLGNLHHQLGDRAASITCFVQLVDDGAATEWELTRAWIGLERLRALDQALAAAGQLVSRCGQPVHHAAYAATLWELRRRDEAEAAMQPIIARDDAAAVRGTAWYYGRTRRARTAHDMLFSLDPADNEPRDFVELFHMLRRDGHLRLAHQTASDAAARLPDHHELARLRDEAAAEVRVFTGHWQPPAREAATVTPVAGRVLHIVGKSAPYAHTGYCVRTDKTVVAQAAAGFDVHVATEPGFPFELGIDAPHHEDVHGVPHHRLDIPVDARRPLHLDERLDLHVEQLSALVEQLRPAVLHAASDFRNALAALATGQRYGLPVVYEMRGFWEETWLAKREGDGADSDAYLLRQQRELAAAQDAARVVTLASTMRDALISRGVAADKISLAPNAVDPTAFPIPPRDEALAGEVGIAPDATVVGYISSFVRYEGIHVLIDAIAEARAAGRNVVGLLVGDGLVRPELERQAADLGVDDHVIFTGRVPHADVLRFYGLIDIFVVPRTNARVCQLVSPLKPFEAMATARALVVSGTPVLRSLIVEDGTGVTFTPEDAHDLADTIVALSRDPDRRRALGAAARAHVLDNHTWAANAARYAEVYAQLGVTPPREG